MSNTEQPASAAWKRQPSEPPKAWSAFAAYRDMPAPERSLDAVARCRSGRQVGRKRAATGRIQAWSRQYRWVERAAAWDRHLDSEAQRARIEARIETQKRHEAVLSQVYDRLVAGMKKKWDGITPIEQMRILKELIHLQRLVLGEPIGKEESVHRRPPGARDSAGTANTASVQGDSGEGRYEMSPEYLAEVMRILARHGGLSDLEDKEQSDARDATPAPVPVAPTP